MLGKKNLSLIVRRKVSPNYCLADLALRVFYACSLEEFIGSYKSYKNLKLILSERFFETNQGK